MSSIFRIIFSLARVLSLEGLGKKWILKDVESQKVQFWLSTHRIFFGFAICHPKKSGNPNKVPTWAFSRCGRWELPKWNGVVAPKENGGFEREFEDTKLEFISYLVDGFSPKKTWWLSLFSKLEAKDWRFFAIWRVKHQIIVPGQARMLKCCRFGVIFVIQILRCLDWTTASRCHNTEWPLKKLEILASKYMPHAVHTISIASYGSIDMMYICICWISQNIYIYTSIAYVYNTDVATSSTAAKCASPDVSTWVLVEKRSREQTPLGTFFPWHCWWWKKSGQPPGMQKTL